MSDRTRYEAQIKHYDTTFGGEFENALSRVMHRLGDLDFFNDAQIALIREEMVQWEWDCRRRQREMQARNRATLESRQTKETA